MNTNQFMTLLVCAFMFTLSELFPPWAYVDGMTSATRSAGYHFVVSEPAQKSDAELHHIFGFAEFEPMSVHSVRDNVKLDFQRATLFLATLSLLLLFNERWRRLSVSMGLLAGLATGCLLIFCGFVFGPFGSWVF